MLGVEGAESCHASLAWLFGILHNHATLASTVVVLPTTVNPVGVQDFVFVLSFLESIMVFRVEIDR